MSMERHHPHGSPPFRAPRRRLTARHLRAVWRRWRVPAAVFVVVFVTLPTAAPGASAATRSTRSTGSTRSYVVASGDNLTAIAGRFDVTVADLRGANDLRGDGRILVGQRLKVPASSPTRLPSRLRAQPARLALRPHVVTWAQRNAIPPDLLEATLWLESGWNQSRVSSTGAIGIGQLMPGTAAFIAGELIGKRLDPHDPHDNIRMSARYLRFLLNLHGGDSTKALQAYYQGIGSIRTRGVYPSTRQYAAAVQALRVRFRSDHTGR
jgi:LysM repeat protein